MGSGRSNGERRAMEAMQAAISSPLLEDVTLDGATGLLVNITGGPNLSLREVDEAVSMAHAAADPDANIIFGSVIDERMGDEVKITVIATGFQPRDAERRPPRAALQVQVPASAPVAKIQPPPLPSPETKAREPQPIRLSSPTAQAVVRAGVRATQAFKPADYDQYDIPTFLRKSPPRGTNE
jgi:cell division protein FtsZ